MFPKNLTIRPALRTWAVCTVLFTGTVLLFSRVNGYGFLNYDDPGYVTNNAHVQAGLTWNSAVWAFTAKTDYWHPLTWLSHMLDWQIYGPNASGHHLTSVVWHAVNAVLAFLVWRRLTGSFWTSAFGAAFFAWHPLRVESVAWITERKDVMSGFFFLLTLWAYAAYTARRLETRGAGSRGFYLLTLALFAAGLMCKPMLVTLPVVLLILDFWPLGRLGNFSVSAAPVDGGAGAVGRDSWRHLVLEKLPFFALSIAASIVTVLLQQNTGAFRLDLPLAARLGNAVVSVARYLGKFFWPFDLTVCYPHPGYWPSSLIAGSAILAIGLTVMAWRQRTARPWVLAGWCWFLVMLLPASGLVQVGFQAMADRYTYLPIMGVQLALLWTLRAATIGRANGPLLGALGGAALCACVVRTWDQEKTWRDPVTLFEHAVAVTDRNAFAHAFLGQTFLSLRRVDEASSHCEQALAIDPQNTTALSVLAEVRQRQGRIEDAAASYRALLRANPADAESEYALGIVLLREGRFDEAAMHLRSAARLQPEWIAANLQLAIASAQHGQLKDAVVHYEAAVAIDPKNAAAYFGIGAALGQLGRTDDALANYERALQLQPEHAGAHVESGIILLGRHKPLEAASHFRAALAGQPDLGVALLGLGRAEQQLGHAEAAAANFERALACAPNDAGVQNAWAETLARRGQFADAAQHYLRAVQLRPGDAGAHAGLGYMWFLSNRREEAIAEWNEALRLDPKFSGLRERLQKLR